MSFIGSALGGAVGGLTGGSSAGDPLASAVQSANNSYLESSDEDQISSLQTQAAVQKQQTQESEMTTIANANAQTTDQLQQLAAGVIHANKSLTDKQTQNI